jgi:hypothetical protein
MEIRFTIVKYFIMQYFSSMGYYLDKRLNSSKNLSIERGIIKRCIIAFVLAITLSSMEILCQNNIQAQVTMYKCTPDMGINVSMVNCLTNSTSDTYNNSMVAEIRQNQSGKISQEAMNGTATQGMKDAMNETGEALSNVTGGVMEGIKDLVNGSG